MSKPDCETDGAEGFSYWAVSWIFIVSDILEEFGYTH
jgi:hypothetical protein